MTNKTVANSDDVGVFLNTITPDQKRDDCIAIATMMGELSGEPAKMWGKSIVGFGTYHYKYESGREGDMMRIGFLPGAQKISLYIITGFEAHKRFLEKLGKYKTGKSCLYINKLADIDLSVLREMIIHDLQIMQDKYPKT